MQSLEVQAKMQSLRNRIQAGEKISKEEMREAILFLREDRQRAQTNSAVKKAREGKAATPKRTAEDLLSDLDNL